MAETIVTRMALVERAAEFGAVMTSTEVTDAAGGTIELESAIQLVLDQLCDVRVRKASVYLVGNGGSASVASHGVTDFLNVGKLRAMTLHDSALLTCMANDYGYETAFARVLSTLLQPADMLIAISSSGQSANIRNAVARARELGGTTVTLSGFAGNNPLRSLGDVNFWLDSRDYGMVEIGHQFVLHNLADRLPREN